jgi:hypothetical protein
MSPYHVNEFSLGQLSKLVGARSRSASYLGQRRIDRLDSTIQQVRKRVFYPKAGHESTRPADSYRSALGRSLGDTLVNKIPNFASFWELNPVSQQSHDLGSYTHFIAIFTPES